MERQHIYVLVGGVGIAMAATMAVVIAYCYVPSDERLDSPAVLEEKVLHGDTTEEQVQAARDMIRHGEAARVQIRRALTEYQGDAAEVKAPLLMATMKTKDWRSMPKVFKMMEDPDPLVRGRAGAAAREIMGGDCFFRANDPPEKRAKIIELMKEEYQIMLPRYHEYYTDQIE